MIYALLADLHANADALRKVLADAKLHGAKRIICLGDIVGYGPEPKACLKLIQENCSVVLAGNHDDAVSGRLSVDDFNKLAKNSVLRHREALSVEEKTWLSRLPYRWACKSFAMAHGDLVDPQKFYYVENVGDAAANFNATKEQLIFVAHTHEPGLFLTGASGKVYKLPPQDFTLEAGKRYIVNPGSVGYPRDAKGTCLSSYVLFDDVERTIVFRTVPFAVSSVMQRGAPRKRTAFWIVAVVFLLALVLLLVGGLSLFRFSRPMPQPAPVAVFAPASVVTNTIIVPSGAKFLIPNLILAKGSAPVELYVEFLDVTNGVVDTYKDPRLVKKSRKAKIPIKKPSASARLLLTVPPGSTSSAPRLESFSPLAQ